MSEGFGYGVLRVHGFGSASVCKGHLEDLLSAFSSKDY